MILKDNKTFKYLLLFLSIFFLTGFNVFAKEIDIDGFEVKAKSSTTEVDYISYTENTIKSSLRFNEVNDYVNFELDLKNNSNKKYKIISVTDNNTNDYLDINYDYNNNEFSKDEISNIDIIMTYKNKLINVDQKVLDNLNITIKLQDNNGNEEKITINPNTKDNILLYVVLFLVSSSSLILIITNHKKVATLVIIVAVAIVPAIIFAQEEYKVDILFDEITVKGEFENYTIVINEDNGNTYETEYQYGQTVGDLSTPTKEGYTFSKWVDSNGNTIDSNTVIEKEMTIKAVYTINNYSITYNLNGGSANNTSSYTIEDEVTINNPTKEGYIFTGWTGSNGNIPKKDLVISRGNTGNKEYTANYIVNEGVSYKVIHKKQNLDGNGYTTFEEETLTGSTNETVTPGVKSYTGFTAPSTQTVTIKADGTTTVTYEYTRNKYTLTLEDADLIDTTATSGDYYYGTELTFKAKTKQGYTFEKWNTNSTDNKITITIEENITIKPIYKANTNTPYKVIHKKQKLDETYEVTETENLTGTTDTSVTPGVKSYTGFTAPSTQTVTIKADGTTTVTYEYTRNKYTLTLEDADLIDTTATSGDYYYGTELTFKAKSKQGYTFDKWSTNDNNVELSITITEDITVKPIYVPNIDTPYKVIHKKQNPDGNGYTTFEEEALTGTTDTSVTPGVKSYTGFTAPSTQTVTIKADGTTIVTYEYTRNKYTLTLEDADLIDTTATSGEYYYGTELTFKAKTKQGYTFDKWSTNDNNVELSITITEDITVKPIYVPNIDTPYKVIHKKQKIDETYEVTETENLTGTTDTSVTPGVKSYTGFTAPSTQTVTIKADGTTTVTYEYTRNKYTLTINNSDNVNTTTPSGEYYYGQEITLEAKPITGYRFTKWSNDVTTQSITFTMTEDITIEPIYKVNSYTIRFDGNGDDGTGSMDTIDLEYGEEITLPANEFVKENYVIKEWNTKNDGTGTSYPDLGKVSNLTSNNNVTITLYVIWKEELPSYEHPDPITFDGQTIIDTGMQLFTEENYKRNFEISLDIDNIDPSRFEQTANRDTIVSSINESGSPWPGTAFRIANKKYEFVGTSGIGTSSKPQILKTSIEKNVKLIRIAEKLYYKVDNNNPVLIKDFTGFNLFFDDTVTLGGALENGQPKSDRYFYGTISNVSIKFIDDDVDISDYNKISNLETVYELAGPYELDGTPEKVLTPTITVDNAETPIKLFTEENYQKDFEISFNIDSYNREDQVFQATLINTKYENESAKYPGVAMRTINNGTKFTVTSTKNGTKKSIDFLDTATSVALLREGGIIKYSYNGQPPSELEDYSTFTEFFDTPVTIGGIIDVNNNIDRCIKMTISNLVIKMEP